MKILVIYDSFFGNTEQIAQAIGAELGSQEDVEILRVGAVKPEQLTDLKLLVVGSPTRQFSPSSAISNLLKEIPTNGFQGAGVAAFDTRFPESEIGKTPVLAFFVRLFGRSAYAATHIARRLKQKGGKLIVPPEGFYVVGVEGPLMEGELERAGDWARQIGAVQKSPSEAT